jgi:hypothetical protein
MSRYTVHMTFQAPAQRGPYGGDRLAEGRLATGRGTVRYVAADGTLAVVGSVRGESPVDAARIVQRKAEADWVIFGVGPVRMVNWSATRERVLVGTRGGSTTRWSAGPGGPPDDGGLAGVREPRRPRTPPGTTSAALDPPAPPG